MAKDNDYSGTLEKYVLFQREREAVSYELSIPVKGLFKLDIYGKDNRKHKDLDLVCSYLIDCGSGAKDNEPLPDDPVIGWGPAGGYLAAYGIEQPSYTNGYINSDTGIVDIKFRLTHALELSAILMSNTRSRDELCQHILLKVSII